MKRITVVGGGISGLTVAYALVNSSQFEVTVLEEDSRPGGKIWTDRAEGFLCEKGVNGFLDNKPKTLELCKNLGMDVLRSNENAKRRFIFSDGKLNALPESPLSFLKSGLMSWHGKLRMVYELIAPKGPEDETVADFVIRRLGKEGLEKLVDPMTSGIFAGDPYRMSIKSCFPRIKELELAHGSLIRALIKIKKERKKTGGPEAGPGPGGNLTSFYNGAQVIIDALAEKLGGRIRLGVSVRGIARRGGKKCNSYKLHTSEGTIDSDIVVLASPAYASAGILKEFDVNLSKTIFEIPYAPVSVVCFGYKREKVLHSLKGFGFLIPHREGRKILGTLWDSSIFPNRAPESHVLLRSMVGGAKSPELAMLEDDKLINMVFDELSPLLSLREEPDMVRVYRWERAIPQYVMGHSEKLEYIGERLKSYPGLYLTGNAYRGVGMNDCIENGYKIADEILLKSKM